MNKLRQAWGKLSPTTRAVSTVLLTCTGLWILFVTATRAIDHFDGDWNQPAVIFQNTNVTNPDIASLINCQWKDRCLEVIDDRKEASFGYLFAGRYYRLSFDPSKNLTNDDSAHYVSINNTNGFSSAFPTVGPQESPLPRNARFLRNVLKKTK